MANPVLEILGDAAALLNTVAPLIATALGGPLAGTAVTFLERALDLAPGSGAGAVAAALKAPTPEQLAAIKKADNDFAVAMRQLDISLDKQDNDDRASARMLADKWLLHAISEKVNGVYCKTKADRRDASNKAHDAMERLGLAA